MGSGGYEGGPQDILLSENDLPLPVTVEGISIINFRKPGAIATIADNVKTTIVTATYLAGTFENLVIGAVSGTTMAKYFLTINGVDVDIRRTSPGRNLQFDFTGAPLALVTGDVVDLKVIHFNTGVFEDFDATIYGYD